MILVLSGTESKRFRMNIDKLLETLTLTTSFLNTHNGVFMKKILTISLLSALCSISFATQQFQANAKARFFPQSWISANSKDVISIQNGVPTGNGSSYYNVQISVNSLEDGHVAGIVVKNCGGQGTTNAVNPGSSIICVISGTNPLITFSSNSATLAASGEYQVE